MAVIVLLYILVCYKIDLPVYWYDWTLFATLEIIALVQTIWGKETQRAFDDGVRSVSARPQKDNLFLEED